MHAIKMQTESGREISETGIVPQFVYLGQFWDGDKPLFERVDIDLDELPDGTAIEIMHIDDTGSYVAHLIKGFDKQWRRITDGAVVSADLIRSWSTRISLIK